MPCDDRYEDCYEAADWRDSAPVEYLSEEVDLGDLLSHNQRHLDEPDEDRDEDWED